MMTFVEAARRLGVHESQVLAVDVHAAGHVVSLRSGVVMLVAESVARVFVPEVDDAEAEPGPGEGKPKAAAKKKPSGAARS